MWNLCSKLHNEGDDLIQNLHIFAYLLLKLYIDIAVEF